MEHLESKSYQPATLSDWARKWGEKILSPLVKVLAGLGFTPNSITVTGLVLNAGAALLLAKGHFAWGGVLVLLAGIFDSLDGSLARLTGQKTRFGAFLDSTFDRYSEAIVFAGLAWFFLDAGSKLEVMLIAATIIGSIMVSYTRARAEGLGFECKVGLLTRFERIIILGAALIFGQARPMLWAMAILTNFTAFQRIAHIWRAARDEERRRTKDERRMTNDG